MHLLFATSIVPDGALASGYEIANAAIIGALRRAGARVTVLGFAWPGKPVADPGNTIVLGAVDVRTESASTLQKLAWLAKAMLSGLTFSSVKLRAVSDETVRAAIERAGPFDGYVLNSVQFAGAFQALFGDRPSIFVAHNVEYASAGENAAAASDIVQRLLFRREARLLRRLEERLCGRARFVFTLAEEDRAALGRIDCDAALIGTWTWQPNRIGLDWFLEKVAPRLRSDFRIRIAGSLPSGMAATHPGIVFVDRVPDARAFVRSAAVIPLISTAGSGVQLKTVETFELGLPSVATSHSLRGIDHRPANCVVTDDPAAFAAALEAAAADVHDVDGGAFHKRQIEALDAAVARGLVRLGAVGKEAFA